MVTFVYFCLMPKGPKPPFLPMFIESQIICFIVAQVLIFIFVPLILKLVLPKPPFPPMNGNPPPKA